MPVYITDLIQILLVIHVLKTGRNRYWIWLLLFLPLIGGAAYLVIEILPEFTRGIQGQRALRRVRKAVNPTADLKQYADAWAQSPNADNARRYAEVLLDHKKFDEAKEILDTALQGFFATEPGLLLLRARTLFETGDPGGAAAILEELNEANPEFRSAEGHLLYARSLEGAKKPDQAVEQYREVANYFPGAEARYRLALALGESGQRDRMVTELEQMLVDARLAPAHFRKSEKQWLDLAKMHLEKAKP